VATAAANVDVEIEAADEAVVEADVEAVRATRRNGSQ
jgi:hypothetical protein